MIDLGRLLSTVEESRRTRPVLFALAVGVAAAALIAAQELALGQGVVHAYQHPPQFVDHTIATSLAERGAYEIAVGKPTFFRPPGNPVVLGAWIGAFGEGPVAVWGLYLLQLSFFALGAALVADLASRVARSTTGGMVAAALWATSPVVARYAGTFMGDVPSAALHVPWWYCLARAWLEPGRAPRWFVGAAVSLTVASTFRPVTLAFLPFILGLALVWPRGRRFLLGATVATAVGVGAFALPWMARNERACGAFSVYSQTGVMAWAGSNWETRGLMHGDASAEFHRRYREGATSAEPGCFERSLNDVYTARAKELLRTQPFWKTTAVWSLNALRTWFGLDVASGTGRWVRWYPLLAAHQLFLLTMAAAGLRRRLIPWDPPWILLCVFCVYLTAAHAVVSTEPRYSLPVIPMISLLAAVRITSWIHRRCSEPTVNPASDP